MNRYPELVIDKGKLADNIREVTARCRARGISVAGVVKGMNGLPELIRVYAESDVVMIGSSRIEQIRDAVEIGKADPELRKPTMMIRIPMLSEVPEIVEYCDYSLESEDAVLRALNDEVLRRAENEGCAIKKHKVILMVEMGDLREGYVGDDLISAALMVENDLDGLELAGVGMNVGCYGSILPTREKLDEFVKRAEEIEAAIGRRLDIISGGATSTLMRVLDGNIPERINHLRIGEGILLAHDLPLFYGCDMSFLHQDIFRLRMEVVELKLKPTYPQGTIGRDAFGHLPEYTDRGDRMRAICACGKVDYGSEEEITPLLTGVHVIGASSDHTLLDVEDIKVPLTIGDVLEFSINYASMVYVTSSRNIHITYK
ncbi:MAG: alanine racemase [Eubacterium sp.]|nr:alanine racemase [Eubacterium sp.]